MAREGGPICISVINMKGGVGKTTVAALLCRYATVVRRSQESGPANVLAIDLDPQANLSQALMGEQGYRQFISNKSNSIVEVFNGYQPPTASTTSASTLDVNDIARRTNNPNLQIIPSRFDFSDNLIDAVRLDERVLARLIANHFQDKDLIIIDCAPTESILTRVAYHASRYILVPVRPEYFPTIGFPLLSESLDTFRRRNRGHQINVIGVVINDSYYRSGNHGGPERRRAIRDIHDDARKNGWDIFKNEIPLSRGFPKLMRGDYSWSGDAPLGFAHFAIEFFKKCGL